jgi:predicted ATP-grasp superfamily ATP-dependent carboligase
MLLSGKASLEKWLLQSLKNKNPLAVVMGSSANGLTFSRSLGRRNVPVLLLDSHVGVGTSSRYSCSWILPAVQRNHSEWLDFLQWLASLSEQKPVLFWTADPHLLFVSRNHDAVQKKFRFLIASTKMIESIIDKRSQYRMAEKARIPIPKTVYPESVEHARSYAADLSYPCILKPYSYRGRSAIGKKAIIVRSTSDLLESFDRVLQTGQPFMIQEIIPGDRRALFAYHGFWDATGRELAWWTKQHVRGIPFRDGSYHVTVDAPEIADLSRRLLKAFNYKGCSHVEFKLDPRDNTYRLMEVNARAGLSSQQGVVAGVDLPWINYQYLTGSKLEPRTSANFIRGVTYVNEPFDIYAFLTLWKAGEMSLLPWLLSFLCAKAKAIWAWDDPWPFLVVARSLTRTGLRKAFSSLRWAMALREKRHQAPSPELPNKRSA